MRELLEKAHQQDDDELFKEEEGDEEFAAPSAYQSLLRDSRTDGQRIKEMSFSKISLTRMRKWNSTMKMKNGL